jgi:hypothetical protein
MKITDRRRKRAMAANPASKQPGASELKRLAAVRVHRFVRHSSGIGLPPVLLKGDLNDLDVIDQNGQCQRDKNNGHGQDRHKDQPPRSTDILESKASHLNCRRCALHNSVAERLNSGTATL